MCSSDLSAEVFLLAAYGMVEDLPTTTLLRRRILLLAERFLV